MNYTISGDIIRKGGRTMIIKCKMCGWDVVFEPPRDKG